MPEKTFSLDIVTPEQVVFSAEVVSVTAPGVEGNLGVLAGHAPLMTELRSGDVAIRYVDGKQRQWWVGGGFMEVARDHAVILADSAQTGEEA